MIKIERDPATGLLVVRAGMVTRLFGKKFYTRTDLLNMLARRRHGQGFRFGDPPLNNWPARALRALDAEKRRQELKNPGVPRAISLAKVPSPIPELRGVRAVVFDAFGTLVQIAEKRRPYLQLHQQLTARGRVPQPDDIARIMSANVGLAGVPGLLGVELPCSDIAAIERELYAELPTIRSREGAFTTLQALRNHGYRLGICSNLAAPYAVPIKLLLPKFDAYAWSFEVGAVKPDPRIYDHICMALGCLPEEVLMIGDTIEADYEGPERFGMHAWHLSWNGTSNVERVIGALEEVIILLGCGT